MNLVLPSFDLISKKKRFHDIQPWLPGAMIQQSTQVRNNTQERKDKTKTIIARKKRREKLETGEIYRSLKILSNLKYAKK